MLSFFIFRAAAREDGDEARDDGVLCPSRLGASVQCLCGLCSCEFYSYRVPCFDTCESGGMRAERVLTGGVPRCRDNDLKSAAHSNNAHL